MTTYQHSPDRLRAFLTAHNLSGSGAGYLLQIDSRTVRRWTAPIGAKGACDMPYSAWYALNMMVAGKPPQ